MGMTREKTAYLEHEAAIPVLRQPANGLVETILDRAGQTLDRPLRLYGSFPAFDAKLNIGPSLTKEGDGTGKSIPTIGSSIPEFVLTTIDFQTGAVTGGTVSITLPAGIVGRFRRCAFTLDNTGTLQAVFSPESATLGGLADPSGLFVAGGLPVGWVDLECTNIAGAYKTAGSLSNIIENEVSGESRVVTFGAGAGGGSSAVQAGQAQTVAIPLGATEITVNFPVAFPATNYVVMPQLENLVDPNPQFLELVITEKTAAGFKAKWNAPTDGADYKLSYFAPVNQVQQGEIAVPLGATELLVTLPITLAGATYTVVAQLVNLVDGSPQFQATTITLKTGAQFRAKWNAPTDGADYRLAFHIAEHT